ncbi:MAG: Rne/Rng family ribonuclease [Candidatus Walczuchella monophlebidarum]
MIRNTSLQQKKNFLIGDIHIGEIQEIVPGLNAAFVNIGYGQHAFLHYQYIGPKLKSFIKLLSCNYTEFIKNGQIILVQITKESLSKKGPKLTSEISLSGRYLILIPFAEKILISKKIKDRKERERLISLIQRIKPKNFGLIIRTIAINKRIPTIENDLLSLTKKWKNLLKFLKQKFTARILRERDRALFILKDLFNEDFTSIICDDDNLCDEMDTYISSIYPSKTGIIKYYRDKEIPIFDQFGIESKMKISLGKHVSLGKGASLIIEHTEALHVIDVNSGITQHKKIKYKNVALDVNILAATEISRQLRLRDMGGLIVVDFIDMVEYHHRQKLYEHLKVSMKNDKAKYQILPPSKFGIIQLTRQRVRPELNIETYEENPSKNIEAPVAYISRIESVLEFLVKENIKKITLHTHPFIAAYLQHGWPSKQQKWFLRYKKWIKIIQRDSFKYLEYQILYSDKN